MSDHLDLMLVYIELTHRYADAVDRGDGDAVAALFADAGRWDGRDFGLTVVTGSDALVEQFTTSEPSGSVHLVTNHLVDRSSSEPRATSYGYSILPRADRVRHLVVRYEDVLVESDGTWRFAERTLRRAVSF